MTLARMLICHYLMSMPNKLDTLSRPLIIVLITIQRLQHKSCVYRHSTSSTQVARVLHHNFFLQSIVACVYTVTIPLASAALSHVLFRSSSFNVFNTSRVCIPLWLSSSKNCCLCLHSNYTLWPLQPCTSSSRTQYLSTSNVVAH